MMITPNITKFTFDLQQQDTTVSLQNHHSGFLEQLKILNQHQGSKEQHPSDSNHRLSSVDTSQTNVEPFLKKNHGKFFGLLAYNETKKYLADHHGLLAKSDDLSVFPVAMQSTEQVPSDHQLAYMNVLKTSHFLHGCLTTHTQSLLPSDRQKSQAFAEAAFTDAVTPNYRAPILPAQMNFIKNKNIDILIIRNFFTKTDLSSIIDWLNRPDQKVVIQQIWLNGHPVWTRPLKGESYGR
jgi:hypothetical protein